MSIVVNKIKMKIYIQIFNEHMTLDVYRGRKTTLQQQQQLSCVLVKNLNTYFRFDFIYYYTQLLLLLYCCFTSTVNI